MQMFSTNCFELRHRDVAFAGSVVHAVAVVGRGKKIEHPKWFFALMSPLKMIESHELERAKVAAMRTRKVGCAQKDSPDCGLVNF